MRNPRLLVLVGLFAATFPFLRADTPAPAIDADTKAATAFLDKEQAKIRDLFEKRAPASAFDSILTELSQTPIPPVHPGAGFNGFGGNSVLGRTNGLRNFVATWQDYLSKPANSQAAWNALEMVITMDATFPAVPRSELLALRNEVAATESPEEAAAKAKLVEFKASVATIIEKATKPEDLDPLVQHVATILQNPMPYYGYGTNPVASDYGRLFAFLTRWQDYLAKAGSLGPVEARNQLRSISNDPYVDTVIPHSRLIALMGGIDGSNGSIHPGDSQASYHIMTRPIPEGLPGVELPAAGPVPPPDQVHFDSFDAFAAAVIGKKPLPGAEDLAGTAYRFQQAIHMIKMKNGDGAITGLMMLHSARLGDYGDALHKVHEEILRQALPLCHATQGEALEPNESEEAYLERLADAARDAGHFDQAAEIVRLGRTATFSPGGSNPFISEYRGYDLFFAAEQQEKAGQWVQAIRSYNAEISIPGKDLPVTETGKRLDRLKQAHPDEYAEALKYAGSNPETGFLPRGP